MDGIQAYADAIASAANPRWKGQRVPWPGPAARPGMPIATRSDARPIAVHSAVRDPALVEQALATLEDFATFAEHAGWGRPAFDAMAGGSSDFDVYLSDSTDSALSYDTRIEARDLSSHLDSAITFSVVDAHLDERTMRLSLASAYAEALIATLDPAEAPAWRRALAAWLVWQWSGAWVRDDAQFDAVAVDATKMPIESVDGRFSWRAETEPRAIECSGLWLALLSASIDNGSGDALCELAHFARQRTWEGYELRGAPDLWMVLETRETLAERKLEDLVEELVVARYLVATRSPSRSPALRAIDAPMPTLFANASWATLPKNAVADERGVEPFGAAYARVDTRDAPVGSLLRVWLTGEFGVEWKLVLLALDASDRVLTRVSTPARDLPRAYFPLELTEPTDHVVAVVINMSSRLPDADLDDENVHSFRVTFDRVQERRR